MTIQIDILNPKATKLLKNLADLKLISIRESGESEFLKVVSQLRKKAEKQVPTMDMITREVELVRAKRHAKKKI
jgi:hypothetical protein